jgi:hypothetical protein
LECPLLRHCGKDLPALRITGFDPKRRFAVVN